MKKNNSKNKIEISKYYFFIVYAVFSAVILVKISDSKYFFDKATLDFRAYYTGAQIVRDGNVRDLYNKLVQRDYQYALTDNLKIFSYQNKKILPSERIFLPFLNPPIVAVLFLPFTFLTLTNAYIIYLTLSIILIPIVIFIIWQEFAHNTDVTEWIILFPPILYTILYGQISHFILLILTMNYIYRKRSIVSGLISGFLFLKLQWLIFIWYFLLVAKDKIKYIAGLSISLAFFILIDIGIYGKNFIFEYPKYLMLNELNIPSLEVIENFNLNGVVAALTGNGISNGLIIFGIISYLVVIALLMKKGIKEDLLFGITTILGLIFNTHTMAPDLIYLLFPLVIIYRTKNKNLSLRIIYTAMYLIPLLGFIKLQWVTVLILLAVAIYMSLLHKLFEDSPSTDKIYGS